MPPRDPSLASGASPAKEVGGTTISIPIAIAINDVILHSSRSCAKDIALVCNQGFDVNDNDKPVPENIPYPNMPLPVSNWMGWK